MNQDVAVRIEAADSAVFADRVALCPTWRASRELRRLWLIAEARPQRGLNVISIACMMPATLPVARSCTRRGFEAGLLPQGSLASLDIARRTGKPSNHGLPADRK
jgi:hypothetical protein